MTDEDWGRRALRWFLDKAEDFFAWCTFKIIQLKDRWGMKS